MNRKQFGLLLTVCAVTSLVGSMAVGLLYPSAEPIGTKIKTENITIVSYLGERRGEIASHADGTGSGFIFIDEPPAGNSAIMGVVKEKYANFFVRHDTAGIFLHVDDNGRAYIEIINGAGEKLRLEPGVTVAPLQP